MEDIAPCPHFLKRLEIIQSELFFFCWESKNAQFPVRAKFRCRVGVGQ